MELVRDKTSLYHSSTCSREEECGSGRGIAQNDRPQRLAAQSNYNPPFKGCQIDLFASRLTRQLKSYVSWRPDPGAIHVDAFTMDWRNLRAYAFPPFNLIPAVLHKTKREIVSVDRPPMVSSALVASVDGPSDRLPCLSREQSKSPNGCVPSKGSSSFIPGSKTSRVDNIRRQFETAGL